MENIEDDPFNLVDSNSSLLANSGCVINNEDVWEAELPTEMNEGPDISEQTPGQIIGQEADIVDEELPTEMNEGPDVSEQTLGQIIAQEADIVDEGIGPNPVRRELSNEDRLLAYQMLLQMSVNGKLKKTATRVVADMFNAKIRAIQRLWKRGKESGNHNVSLNRVRNCGRKRIELDIQRIREIPLK